MIKEIAVSRQGPVQIIRLNRPEKKNALTGDMYLALGEALATGDAAADVAAHVIFGSGGVFCAGNDIGDFLSFATGDNAEKLDAVLGFIGRLPGIKKPVIAGVAGLASGIGVTLLFHCDLVYASASASFTTPFLDLGLVPEAGSSLLGPRLMGHQRAFEMLVLGEPFSAERARDAGLVNAVVAPEALEEKAISAALRLARKPPEALEISRRLLRGDPAELTARIDEESRHFRQRLATPEAKEAFTAFFEKRAPDFAKITDKT
jgi:enoyl-CoA hydratase/carnithine racemase